MSGGVVDSYEPIIFNLLSHDLPHEQVVLTLCLEWKEEEGREKKWREGIVFLLFGWKKWRKGKRNEMH